jgi:hypothetical protein
MPHKLKMVSFQFFILQKKKKKKGCEVLWNNHGNLYVLFSFPNCFGIISIFLNALPNNYLLGINPTRYDSSKDNLVSAKFQRV